MIARSTKGVPGFELLDPRWQRVERLQLIRRQVIESLSPAALELLMQRAEVLVEGGMGSLARAGGEQIAYATLMLTVDLRDCEGLIRERVDEVTAQRVAELMRNDERALVRIREIARPHLEDYFDLGPCTDQNMEIDFRVRTESCLILIDADLSLATSKMGEKNDQKCK